MIGFEVEVPGKKVIVDGEMYYLSIKNDVITLSDADGSVLFEHCFSDFDVNAEKLLKRTGRFLEKLEDQELPLSKIVEMTEEFINRELERLVIASL
ncbi:MAG: hypothetical protein JHC31_14545 [Sulfurihydrogenibium sp.]|jgi:hypothetical protein|nr:hypothetical protein [Sulfurihydrogenibium sp.]